VYTRVHAVWLRGTRAPRQWRVIHARTPRLWSTLSRHLCSAREFLSLPRWFSARRASRPRSPSHHRWIPRAGPPDSVGCTRASMWTYTCVHASRGRVRVNVGRGRVMISRLFTRVLSLSAGIISVIRAPLVKVPFTLSLPFSLSLALRSGVGKFAWPRGYVFVSNDLCRQMGRARVKVSCRALSMTAIDGTLECASRKNAASRGIRN